MRLYALTLAVSLAAAAAEPAAEKWTRFRGPNGSGLGEGTGYPVEFGASKNLAWRAVARPGKSSPVLTDRHVFLTGAEGSLLYTQCFDRASGKLVWERSIERTGNQLANRLNHAAAITPVTDGSNVYVFFKDFGLVSYAADGKERWRSPVGPFTTSMGLGASPVLAGNDVVLVADQLEGSFIAAFQKSNGEMRWKTARDEAEGWGTPLVTGAGAGLRVLTTGRGQYGAYTMAGKRVANLGGLATAMVASPVMHGDKLFVFGYGTDTPAPFSTRLSRLDKNADGKLSQDEFGDDPFLAGIARFGGNRDMVITEDEWLQKQREVMGPNMLTALRVAADGKAVELWRHEKNYTGVIPSPLVYQGVVYVVKNGGILTTLDEQTGKEHKTGRVEGALGGYSASPVAADGRVYLASEEGKVAVLRAGSEWEVAAVNDLGEPCYATPALSGGGVYVRTDAALYRFGSR